MAPAGAPCVSAGQAGAATLQASGQHGAGGCAEPPGTFPGVSSGTGWVARSAAGPPSTSAADAKTAGREGAGARARTPARSAVASAADAAHSRGYALRKQGNFLGAVEAYSEAIKLQPAHFKALFNRAFSYDKVACLAALGSCQVHASSPGLRRGSVSGRRRAVGPVGKGGGGLWQGAACGAKEQLCALQSRARWHFQCRSPLGH